MTNFGLHIGSFVVLAAITLSMQTSAPVSTLDARNQLGKTATICGVVVTHHCPRDNKTTYLDLDTAYWEDGVRVAIPITNRTSFGLRPEDRYLGHTICATGRVSRKDKRYLLAVEMPADVDSRQAPANVPPPLAPSAYRPCDDGIVVPVPTRQVEPTYTDAARQARKKGIVLLDAVVLADGTVGEVRVVRSLDSTTGLDEASVRALRAWRFKPGTLAGQPVPVVVGVQLTFTP